MHHVNAVRNNVDTNVKNEWERRKKDDIDADKSVAFIVTKLVVKIDRNFSASAYLLERDIGRYEAPVNVSYFANVSESEPPFF